MNNSFKAKSPRQNSVNSNFQKPSQYNNKKPDLVSIIIHVYLLLILILFKCNLETSENRDQRLATHRPSHYSKQDVG